MASGSARLTCRHRLRHGADLKTFGDVPNCGVSEGKMVDSVCIEISVKAKCQHKNFENYIPLKVPGELHVCAHWAKPDTAFWGVLDNHDNITWSTWLKRA